MEDDAPVIYGLEFQGRALCPQHGEADAIRFLVGTQSLKAENQVHLIDFDDESNIINKYIFRHTPGEIWHLNSCPSDKNILSTCYNSIQDGKTSLKATLWQMPPLDETEPPSQLEPMTPGGSHMLALQKLVDLDANHGDVKGVLWNPSGDNSRVVCLTERHIDVWNVDTATASSQVSESIPLEGKAQLQFNVGRFNPHHGGWQIATAVDSSVQGWDLRSIRSTFNIPNAHSQTIRDLDFNPNRQYYMVTCSDDCRVKFWDTRNLTKPLMVRTDHSHWVWSVRYNHFHDQLVLTSSSDSRVVLSSIASLSSEPYGHLDEDDEEENREPAEDRIICQYDEHEDSVYACEWSTADPWIFASLSYDGRLVINRVPRVEKYKILL